MIGYYVHHQGRGHLHRALAIAAQAGSPIIGLSTLPVRRGGRADWVELADDAGAVSEPALTAGGRLHYVPYGHEGLRERMSTLSGWIGDTRPDAMVVDVSVEVALLARLHGTPVLTMAQPGRRVDPAHTLGYTISEQILAPWPAGVGPIWQADATATTGKLIHLGAVSRFGVLTDPEWVHHPACSCSTAPVAAPWTARSAGPRRPRRAGTGPTSARAACGGTTRGPC